MHGDPRFFVEAAAVLLCGAVWLGIVAFLRFTEKKTFTYLTFFSVFYVYLFKVLDYTLFQYQSLLVLKYLAPNLVLNGYGAGQAINIVPLITLTLGDLETSLLNILMLVPFGFGLPFITSLRLKSVVLLGALFSLFIELMQLSTGLFANVTFRVADINDLIFNTAGALIGYSMFIGFTRLYRRLFHGRAVVKNPISRHILERRQA